MIFLFNVWELFIPAKQQGAFRARDVILRILCFFGGSFVKRTGI